MLDDLIDDVARGLTAEGPSHDFARRVIARVADVTSPQKYRRWPRAWMLVPLAASIAVLAVLVVRETRPTFGRLKPDASNALKSDDTRKEPIRLKPDATASLKPEATSAPKPDTAGHTSVARASEAARQTDIEPLTAPPLEMEPLQLSPLAHAERIEIDPIAIERIDIAAMP